jgi:hypothetical protein
MLMQGVEALGEMVDNFPDLCFRDGFAGAFVSGDGVKEIASVCIEHFVLAHSITIHSSFKFSSKKASLYVTICCDESDASMRISFNALAFSFSLSDAILIFLKLGLLSSTRRCNYH